MALSLDLMKQMAEAGATLFMATAENEEIAKLKKELQLKSEYISKEPYNADNWDDNGSIGYTQDSVDGAIMRLINYAKEVYLHNGMVIKEPYIFPGKNGGIDFLWKNQVSALLRFNKTYDIAEFSSSYSEDGYKVLSSEGIVYFSPEHNPMKWSFGLMQMIPPII